MKFLQEAVAATSFPEVPRGKLLGDCLTEGRGDKKGPCEWGAASAWDSLTLHCRRSMPGCDVLARIIWSSARSETFVQPSNKLAGDQHMVPSLILLFMLSFVEIGWLSLMHLHMVYYSFETFFYRKIEVVRWRGTLYLDYLSLYIKIIREYWIVISLIICCLLWVRNWKTSWVLSSKILYFLVLLWK